MKSPATEGRVLIIGYGNTLRGDDGAGVVASEMIRAVVPADDADVIVCHQLTPELATRLASVSLAIFLDASQAISGGEIRCDEVLFGERNETRMHHVEPLELLSLSRRLYGRCPRGFAVAIGGESWGFSTSLSTLVAAALPKAVEHVVTLIAEYKADSTPVSVR